MSRDIQLEDIRTPPETAPTPAATPSLDRWPAVLDRSGRPLPGDPIDVRDLVRLPSNARREPVQVGELISHLRASEVHTLTAVGTFRTLFARDLEHYATERTRKADVRSLHEQGLIVRRRLVITGESKPLDVLTLTSAGKELLEHHRLVNVEKQQFYAGFVRPRELRHDASLYRVVAAERKKIQSAGGKITRVILDHEFKNRLYTNSEEANTLQLNVLNGHVQLPDARVEYENAAGERAHIDLELVTEHYHAAHLLGNAQRDSRSTASAVHAPAGPAALRTTLIIWRASCDDRSFSHPPGLWLHAETGTIHRPRRRTQRLFPSSPVAQIR